MEGFPTTVAAILSWYTANIGVLLLNKMVLSSYDFKYPIFLTCCHMISSTIFSFLISLCNFVPHQKIKSRSQLWRLTLLAAIFCVSIVSGNASLRYIPVSFNQAIGATTPAFTALLAFFVIKKKESKNTYLSLIPVVLGIVIASGWEPSFEIVGFSLCVFATAARAFKTVLQSLLLSDPSEKLDSLNLLYYMSPIATLILLPFTFTLEDAPHLRALHLLKTDQGFLLAFVVNVVLAYFINLTNFLVTRYTSALTLQVLGNAKGVVAVVVSVMMFRNPVSVMGMLGYGVTVFGVCLYSEAKRQASTGQKKDLSKSLLGDVESPERTKDSEKANEKATEISATKPNLAVLRAALVTPAARP